MSIKRVALASLIVGVTAMAASIPTVAEENTAASVTFNKDVLPILQKNCQGCHRPGEIAPMSLLTYAEARPWAKAMKAAVITRKMPPWFADPKYGHFANDRRLSDAEIGHDLGLGGQRRAGRQPEGRAAPRQVPGRLEHSSRT